MVFFACAAKDSPGPKSRYSLITTPLQYYSTPKAKYLAERYRDNLDRIVERIVRNPKTSTLQFANNIANVGGIGFFTHSAAKVPDERYLEVVLGVSETFEGKGEHSAKVFRLFSSYGAELISILAADPEIFDDKEVAGYGLNLSWRSLIADSPGTRVILERAIVYVPKDRARSFLKLEISQDRLLRDAAIFAAEEDAPIRLVSYRPPEPKPDARPAIHEEAIANNQPPTPPSKPESSATAAESAPANSAKTNADPRAASTGKQSGRTASSEAAPSVAVRGIDKSGKLPAETGESNQNLPSNKPPASTVASDTPAAKSSVELPQPLLPSDGAEQQVAARKELAPLPDRRKERLALTPPSSLHGYIIQLSLGDRGEAQRWAETLERRGHVISVTEPAGGGPIRVRVGNFAQRSEAERQLQRLQKEGLTGMILNLPQAYQPEIKAQGTGANQSQ